MDKLNTKLLSNLRQSHFKTLFNLSEDLLILLAADKRDGQPLGSESASATDTMKVRAGICGQVVIDGKVDALNVNAATENISRNTDPLVEFLELLEALNTAGGVSRCALLKAKTNVLLTVPPG